jgi:hypothetical protein
MFRQLCGDNALQNVVIVTNMWGEVSTERGEARELQLGTEEKFFKPVLDKGAVMVRHFNIIDTAHVIIRHILEKHPVALQVQRELVDEKKNISETAAGEELNRQLQKLMEKHEKEMNQLREDMQGKRPSEVFLWTRSDSLALLL